MEYKIRPIERQDAAGICELRRMRGVLENTLGNPSERIKKTTDWIDGMGQDSFQFVAVRPDENGEEVIGCGGIDICPSPRKRHCASFGIMIHKEYQNQGVGSALTEAILDVADNWLKLVRVELTVFCDNDRAVHLYEKYGFQKEGIRRMASIRQGVYADEYMMARIKD